MTDKERIRKVVDWLIYVGHARNEKEVAEKLGYTKSSFSQIINGRLPISKRFVERLSSIDENINKVWIFTGEGLMLQKDYSEDTVSSIAADAETYYGREQFKEKNFDLSDSTGKIEIQALLDLLKEKDRQIEVLQTQISDLINLMKS